jgi:hypothetical protein
MPTFVMTIDVEPDSPAWANITEFRVENVGRLQRLQAVCDREGVRPTYLTTYAVATDPGAEKILAGLLATGRCEIGAHLHPSETPPKLERPVPETSIPHLPAAVKEAKFRTLHEALASRFGAPTAFRAGRYRLDAPSVAILESLGYRADTSVTPHVSWVLEKGRRWSDAPERPYRLSREDPARPGQSSIIEFPVTIREGRRYPLPGKRLVSDLFSMPFRSLPRPAFRLLEWIRPVRPRWLRPTYADAGTMISLVDEILSEDPEATLNLMFHSNELAPGTSPFVRTEAEAEDFLDRVEKVCRHVASLGVKPVTLSEAAAFRAERMEAP